MSEELEYLWDKRHSVIYRIELSVLYHQKRSRFFDALDKSAKAIAVIGGSAAFWKIGGESNMMYVAALITVSSTFALVFGFSDKARRHSELSRDFIQLEAQIVGKGEREFTEADLAGWSAQLHSLEASEPAALSGLVRLCQNELAAAYDHPELIRPLGPFQRLVAHLWDVNLKQPAAQR
jgi:hypothetical protein